MIRPELRKTGRSVVMAAPRVGAGRPMAGLCALLSLLMLLGTAGQTLSPARAATFTERAQEYFEQGELDAAKIELHNALQRDPNDAEARLLLGKIHLKLGDVSAAEKELLRAQELGFASEELDLMLAYARLAQQRFGAVISAIGKDPVIETEVQRDLYVARGEALMGLGHFDEAQEAFDRVLRQGTHVGALVNKARIAIALGETEEARSLLDMAAKVDPNDMNLIAVDAAWHFQERRFEEAKARFLEASQLDPSRLDNHIGLVQSFLALGELDDAARVIENLKRSDPQNLLIVLQDAIVQFMRADYRAAKTAADRVLAANSTVPRALLIAGYSAFQLEEYDQARARLTTLVVNNPSDIPTRMVLGATLLRLGKTQEAYEVVGTPDIEVPDNSSYLRVLTSAAFGAGDRQAGLRYLEQLAAKTPDDYEVQVQLGAVRMSIGDPTGAIVALNRAREIDPTRVGAYARLFSARMQLRETEKALEVARAIVDRFPEEALGDTLIGIAYLSIDDRAQARAAFEQALQKKPGSSEAANNLANMLRIEGESERAREVLQGVLEVSPTDLRTLLAAAELDAQTGDLVGAAALLQRAVASHPGELRPVILLANHYNRERRFAEALSVVEPALLQHPASLGLLEAAGHARLNTGDRSGAVEAFEQLARSAPHAQESLMFALERNGQVAEAIQAAERTLEMNPDNARARFARVRYLAQLGRLAEAKAALEPLKAALPDHGEVLLVEGRIALMERRAEEAINIFRRLFDLQRDNLKLMELSRALFAGGRIDDGLAMMERWLEDHPDDVLTRSNLAEAYLSLSRYAEASRQYKKLLEIMPNSPRVLNNLAWVQTELGEAEAAVPLARKARNLAPQNPNVADTLAMALLKGGEKEEALALLEQVRREFSGDTTIRFRFAQALAENGRDAEAVEELQKLLEDTGSFRERTHAEQLLSELTR